MAIGKSTLGKVREGLHRTSGQRLTAWAIGTFIVAALAALAGFSGLRSMIAIPAQILFIVSVLAFMNLAAAAYVRRVRESRRRADVDARTPPRDTDRKTEARLTGEKIAHSKYDIEDAMLDPAKVFDDPMSVVTDEELSHAVKRKILQQWELDSRELQVAQEENMGGGEQPMLAQVQEALRVLEGEGAHPTQTDTKLG